MGAPVITLRKSDWCLLPFLLLGPLETPAIAQTQLTSSSELAAVSKAPDDQASDFINYILHPNFTEVLPTLQDFENSLSITGLTNAIADSTDDVMMSLEKNFGKVEKTALKAATFEILSAALEAGMFVTFFGGTAATAGGIFVLSFVSSTAIYVAHEYAWIHFTPHNVSTTAPQRIASKTATYRALSILRTFTVGSVAGGAHEVVESVAFTLSVTALDTALYSAIEYSFETLFADAQLAENSNISPR